MTEKNRKLSKDILDMYLKECHNEHKVQISEKYIGYIMLAMEDYAKKRNTLLDKLGTYTLIICGVVVVIGSNNPLSSLNSLCNS